LPLVFLTVLVLSGCRTEKQRLAELSGEPDAETYSFYSELYRNSTWLEKDEVLGIAAGVGAVTDNPAPFSCVKPTTPGERRMVADALEIGKHAAQWQRRFDFGREYRILCPRLNKTTPSNVFIG